MKMTIRLEKDENNVFLHITVKEGEMENTTVYTEKRRWYWKDINNRIEKETDIFLADYDRNMTSSHELNDIMKHYFEDIRNADSEHILVPTVVEFAYREKRIPKRMRIGDKIRICLGKEELYTYCCEDFKEMNWCLYEDCYNKGPERYKKEFFDRI